MIEPIKKKHAVPDIYMLWPFRWNDEAPVYNPVFKDGLDWSGNMFGINLGRPHRLTTTFNFRDIDQYFAIKKYLADIDLVALSDIHIRPKGSIPIPQQSKGSRES